MHGYLIVIVSFIMYFAFIYLKKRKRNYPPGPVGLPVVGYLPFMSKNWSVDTFNLSKKYGEIFSLKIGSNHVVFLCSGRILKEAFSKTEFLDRPTEELEDALCFKSPLISANGRLWREHRRFMLHTFRDLGLGKTRMNEFTQEEVRKFLDLLAEQQGKPVDPTEDLGRSIINIISILLFGKPDALGKEGVMLLDETATRIGTFYTLISLYFPWIRKLPYLGEKLKNHMLREKVQDLQALMNKEVEEHRKTFDPSDIRDFTDAYLLELIEHSKERKGKVFSESFLTPSLQVLYGGAKESIRQTMRWAFYTLAVFQDVQTKIQKEIDNVIGKERYPAITDQSKLPITQAVIMEVLRWRASSVIIFPRVILSAGATVGGYNIPKRAFVLGNLLAAHHNASEWEKPEEFIPSRFLNSDETCVVRPPNFAPFISGKRGCPGEGYSMNVLFLYIASILQKFTIRLPDGHIPDFEPIFTISATWVKQHELLFIPRNVKNGLS